MTIGASLFCMREPMGPGGAGMHAAREGSENYRRAFLRSSTLGFTTLIGVPVAYATI